MELSVEEKCIVFGAVVAWIAGMWFVVFNGTLPFL